MAREFFPWKVRCANSTCFSPDGSTVYFADSPHREIWYVLCVCGVCGQERRLVLHLPFGHSCSTVRFPSLHPLSHPPTHPPTQKGPLTTTGRPGGSRRRANGCLPPSPPPVCQTGAAWTAKATCGTPSSSREEWSGESFLHLLSHLPTYLSITHPVHPSRIYPFSCLIPQPSTSGIPRKVRSIASCSCRPAR